MGAKFLKGTLNLFQNPPPNAFPKSGKLKSNEHAITTMKCNSCTYGVGNFPGFRIKYLRTIKWLNSGIHITELNRIHIQSCNRHLGTDIQYLPTFLSVVAKFTGRLSGSPVIYWLRQPIRHVDRDPLSMTTYLSPF